MHSGKLIFCSLALFLAGGLAAQTPTAYLPRKAVKLNGNTLLSRGSWFASQGNLQIASPKEVLPSPGGGLHATPLLAYAAWVEQYGTPLKAHVMFSASTDGGFTWSKPKEIYVSTQIRSGYDFENMVLGATKNQVYVGICTGKWNSTTKKAWPNDVYLLASPDEGKTWIGPVLLNTKSAGKGDADTMVMACADGKAHVGYKFAYFKSGTTSQGPNDYYYVGAEIKNGKINIFAPEKKIDNPSAAPGATPYVNYCNISADGSLVACVWSDGRVSGSKYGNLYAAVSTDGGLNFKETKLTNYGGSLARTDKYWEASVVVSGKNIYIAYGGVYTIGGVGKWPNNTSFVFSNDKGKTFQGPVILNPGGKGADTDRPMLAADGDLVCVVWVDNRDGSGNTYNAVFAACDDKGGKGFLNKVTEVRIGAPPKTVHYDGNLRVAVLGKHIVLAGEEAKLSGGGEDAFLAMSDDGGKSFSLTHVTKIGPLFGGTKDVDDPRVSLTRNGDVLYFWADNAMSSSNNIYVSGLKLPELTYLGKGKGFSIGHFTAAEEGQAAIILVTEAGTNPPLNLDGLGYVGFSMNFAVGTYTPVFAMFTSAYVSVVKNGKALFPNAPDGLGLFHAAALGLDAKTLKLTWFTDPVVY